MIDAHRIVYNNLSSDEFDVIPGLSFGGDDGATESFLGREGVYTEHYDGHRTIHRAKYNEAFTPRFTLIKKDYGDFDANENRKILSWLTSSEKPGWLEVYKDDSNVLEWRVFGCITSIEQYKLGSGRVVGYEFEMESSHPYAWSRQFIYPEVYNTIEEIGNNDETNDYLQVNGTKPITISCNTDEYNKLLYPKVIIDFRENDIYFPVGEKPIDADLMIPNTIYKWSGKYFVRVGAEVIEVTSIEGGAKPSSELNGESPSGYFHIKDGQDHTIQKAVNDQWEFITKVGAAVKISTTYTLNDTAVSKDIILKGVSLGEVITLDGMNKVISVDAYTKNDGDARWVKAPNTDIRVIGEDFNWEWLPLTYGENNIAITGNCKVQIRWIEPRKVGSL